VSAGWALDIDLSLDGIILNLNSPVHISRPCELTSLLDLLPGIVLLLLDGLTNFFMKFLSLVLNVLTKLLGLRLSHCGERVGSRRLVAH
jgi:hypothetical protein